MKSTWLGRSHRRAERAPVRVMVAVGFLPYMIGSMRLVGHMCLVVQRLTTTEV